MLTLCKMALTLGIYVSIITAMDLPRLIPVGKENFAIVDCEMFDHLNKFRWHLSTHSYASTSVSGSMVFMHRMVTEATKGQYVDHKNNNGLDNRKSNLRLCTQSQNCANSTKMVAKNDRIVTSRFKGVSFRSDRKRWAAYIGTGKGRDALGCFSTEEAAALAYNNAAILRYGEFAKLNIIPDNSL